jgi:hypothetical protein
MTGSGLDTLPSARRDDRVRGYTRLLAAVIIPFLVAAFVLLYVFPADTARLFAWTITSRLTAMVLASAYLGGAYFFGVVVRGRGWHTLAPGFPAVATFATLLGVATVVHWDRFNHANPAFWIWAVLYFVTPFLVLAAWVGNRRYAAPPRPGERRIGRRTRWVVAGIGAVALLQGVLLYLVPAAMIPLWPWPLTPLTARVVGAIFCLGGAGLVTLRDDRWSSLRLMVQVAGLMIVLILVALARAWYELDPTRPLTWLLVWGLLAVLVGAVGLWRRMET